MFNQKFLITLVLMLFSTLSFAQETQRAIITFNDTFSAPLPEIKLEKKNCIFSIDLVAYDSLVRETFKKGTTFEGTITMLERSQFNDQDAIGSEFSTQFAFIPDQYQDFKITASCIHQGTAIGAFFNLPTIEGLFEMVQDYVSIELK